MLLYRAGAIAGATKVPSLPQSVDVTKQLGQSDVSIAVKQGSKVKGKEAGAGKADDRKKGPCNVATAAQCKSDGGTSSPEPPSPPEPLTAVPSDTLLRYDNPLYREPRKVVRRDRSIAYIPECEQNSSSDDGGSASSFASVISGEAAIG